MEFAVVALTPLMVIGCLIPTTSPIKSSLNRDTAIALHPSGNGEGSWYFMSLFTGAKIHTYQWRVLPMPTDTLKRVYEITELEE